MSPPDEEPAATPFLVSPLAVPARSKLDLSLETSVVILICVISPLFNSIASLFIPHAHTTFLYQPLSNTLRSLEKIALVLFMIHRSGEPLNRFGLRRFRIFQDFFGGIGAFVIEYVAYYLGWILIILIFGRRSFHGDYSMFARPSGTGEYALLALVSVCNGIAEEIVLRAYLIPRFEQLLGSSALAISITTILFASYHGYQGPVGVISATITGLTYGALFCIFRRFWPLALGHALQDFISIALMK